MSEIKKEIEFKENIMSVIYHSFYKDNSIMYRHVTDENPDNESFCFHIHNQYEIFYFIKGIGSLLVETTTYPLVPDTMIIIRPLETHRISISDSTSYERFTINFSEELINDIDPEHTLLTPFNKRPLGENNSYHASEFDISPYKLLAAMQKKVNEDTDKLSVLTYFYSLLGQINVAFNRKKQNNVAFKKSAAAKVAEYINAHLFEDLSVTILAKHFFVSVSQLNRQFKKASGFSVWEYIVEKRLISAKKLIKDGTPATHAYAMCGFNDYSSFYRLYVKKFGTSPKNDSDKK